jgi:hypothetical protein
VIANSISLKTANIFFFMWVESKIDAQLFGDTEKFSKVEHQIIWVDESQLGNTKLQIRLSRITDIIALIK